MRANRARITGEGPISTRTFDVGGLVLARGRVRSVRLHSAVVGLPTVKCGEMAVEMPISELFEPPESDGAAQAVMLLVDRLHHLQDLALRIQAEIYELGGHAAAISR